MSSGSVRFPTMFATVSLTVLLMLLSIHVLSSDAAPAPQLDVYDDILDGDHLLVDLFDSLGAVYEADEHYRPHKREQPPNAVVNGGRPPAATTGNQDRCHLPVRKGVCRAIIPRWSFDPTTGACNEFKFGGCDGNGNNFSSQRQCEEMCKGKR